MARRRSVQNFIEDLPSEPDSTVAVGSITLPKFQPRRYFNPEKQAELERSLKEHGVLQPLLVRPVENSKYELVAGERRLRAATTIGLTSVPVVIREFTPEQARTIALVENLQREDLTPLEETEGILALLVSQLGESEDTITTLLHKMKNADSKNNVILEQESQVEQVFERLGMTWQSFATNRLPLLNLPEDVLDVLRKGKLEYTKARAIARVKDATTRVDLLNQAIQENLSLSEIKQRIKALTEQPTAPSHKTKAQDLARRVNKAKLWDVDPKRWAKVEKLMNQISELLD